MQLLTLFARKEPTADTVSIQHGLLLHFMKEK